VDHPSRPHPADGPRRPRHHPQVSAPDPDSRFSGPFDAVFAADGIQILTSPPGAPRANAICERLIATLRRELLDKVLVVNERHLHRILTIYLHHFNNARPHRSLAQAAPLRALPHPETADIKIIRRDRLGGAIPEYQQVA